MAETVSRFTETYRQAVEQAAQVVDPRAQYRGVPIRERAMRCIWYGQYLATDSLRTVDGQALNVTTPGWWNVESGPDFLKGELSFDDGPIQRGDIEIHLYASGWYDHQHHENPRYNRVLLHVVLWNDREDDFVVNQLGEPVRQLVVEDNVAEDLGDLLDQLAHEDFPEPPSPTSGLCRQYAEEGKVDEDWVADFLDHAGDERILRKARALSRRVPTEGEEQVFYEALMGALGYKKNKKPFEALARAVPLSALRQLGDEDPVRIQASLFRAAGLLPTENYLPGLPDPETHDLLKRYRESAARDQALWAGSALRKEDWNLSGARPVNFPTRRIAAAAHFLTRNLGHGLLDSFQESLTEIAPDPPGTRPREAVRQFRDAQAVLFAAEDPYWSYRCVFAGKPSAKALRLVGQERVDVIWVNVVLPALLARARHRNDAALESLLHRVYDCLPVLSETHVTRFMGARVFGDALRAEALITSARRQQGIYQLYTDFERDDRTCEDCAFARAMLLA